jgi:hypothetical protein
MMIFNCIKKTSPLIGLLFLIGCSMDPIPDTSEPPKPKLDHQELMIILPQEIWPKDDIPDALKKIIDPYMMQSKKTSTRNSSFHMTLPHGIEIEKIINIRNYFEHFGLRPQMIHVSKHVPINKAQLDFYEVTLPKCGQWMDDGKLRFSAKYANFACATQYNHLLSLQDPVVLFKIETPSNRDAKMFIKKIDTIMIGATTTGSAGGAGGSATDGASGSSPTSALSASVSALPSA